MFARLHSVVQGSLNVTADQDMMGALWKMTEIAQAPAPILLNWGTVYGHIER
jgi:hypothetical protein